MGLELFLNKIPIPAFIINLETKQLTTNTWFDELCGVSLGSIEQLNELFISGGHFQALPEKPEEMNGCIKLADGRKICLKLTYNPYLPVSLSLLLRKMNFF